jgi:KipI family sensor histidine kinase inhibitor
VRILPAGPRALLIELAGQGEVEALHAEISRRRAAGAIPPVEDVVPAARTILLDGLGDPAALAAELPAWRYPPAEAARGRLVEIPVTYDGADLAEVARGWDMSVPEAISTHLSLSHRVAFCGFAPGFAYLSGLPAELAVPRRNSPRPRVPAGSVALAGEFTGIYPRSSPGGWQLVGRTGIQLWDAGAEPPALLTPGTRVRFVAVRP